jgi:tetratricopeptide (TPR) repeat protein
MIKKYLILILITFLLNNPIYSNENAVYKMGTDDLTHLIGKNSNIKKATDAIKQAKRYAKKGKADKAKKRFNDVIKFLILANEENPNEPDILNYLGYSFKKVGDIAMAEIYYERGLAIDPRHTGINEYLGKLYIETNRIDKAKERLKVLEDCKCKEFDKLQNLISKY